MPIGILAYRKLIYLHPFMIVEAKNIHKSFGKLEVLKDVSLSINKGEIVAIVGPSGAGKTTLLQILGTLDNTSNTEADININGQHIQSLSKKELATFRNESIGFIFQFHQLLPEFTALENVCIPAFIGQRDQKHTEQKALELLKFLGVEKRKDHKPNELSGGEQQRVAVARALINDPKVIFADEPSGNLDSHAATQLHELFFKLRDNYGQTFIIVTHNQELANMADRKIEMIDGKIIND